MRLITRKYGNTFIIVFKAVEIRKVSVTMMLKESTALNLACMVTREWYSFEMSKSTVVVT